MSSIVTNLFTWGAKEAISSLIGGGSSGGGGSSAGQAIAAQSKQTQQQLASISARQVMSMYNAEKNKLQSVGQKESRPPDTPSPHRKSNLGVRLVNAAGQAAVSDPVFDALIQRQAHSLGKSISSEATQVLASNSYIEQETGTEPRVRQTSRGSFLDPSTNMGS